FAVGAAIPVAAVTVGRGEGGRIAITAAASMMALASLGLLGARLGGARPVPAALRVSAWGAAAMALTFAIGALVGEVGL
ncbi:MAG: VIT1/CCC1 transporter family protein, partial [Gaiellaceae bacterium]